MQVFIGDKETKATLCGYDTSGKSGVPNINEIVTFLSCDKEDSAKKPDQKYYRIIDQRWIVDNGDMNIYLLVEEVKRPTEWGQWK